MISDYGKLIALCVGMFLGAVCGTILLVTGAVSEAAGVGILTATLVYPIGYMTGNGRLAVRKSAPSSVLVATLRDDQAATVIGPVPALSVPIDNQGGSPDA